MAKYLVGQKFRLVDENVYLEQDTIFEPEDRYIQTSRSLAAALRSGWLVKISDEEAAKHQEMMDKASPSVRKAPLTTSTVDKPKELPKMNDDMKPQDLADEVVGDNAAILTARDKRRQDALKAARPIRSESSVEPVEPVDTEISETEVVPKKASTSVKSEAAMIKHEIKSRIRSKKVKK